MAIMHMDAFELGTVALIQSRYETVNDSGNMTVGTSSGRTNQYAKLSSTELVKTLPTPTNGMVIGYAHKWDGSPTAVQFLKLYDTGGTVLITLQHNRDGTLALYRGTFDTGTLLATSAAVTLGFWMYVELKVVIHNTEGLYDLRVNETSLFSSAGVDTQLGANQLVYKVSVGGRSNGNGIPTNTYIDDYYIANLSQPIPANGFYGNIKIEHLPPNTAGSATQWTPFPSNVSNWDNVNEYTRDDDTSYNYASTVNHSDLYSLQNMSAASGSIRAIQVTHSSRKDDALPRVVAPLIRSGSLTAAGQNDSLTTSYAYYMEVWGFNPNTSDWFTISEVNALEAGIRVIT
jgi:hypothetical protein